MPKINIKALSANDAWQGKRFKTPEYKAYEVEFISQLPPQNIPNGKLTLRIEFGVSSPLSDVDNLLKTTLDCLQKRYGFNDKHIYEIFARKVDVKKKEEYIRFHLSKYV